MQNTRRAILIDRKHYDYSIWLHYYKDVDTGEQFETRDKYYMIWEFLADRCNIDMKHHWKGDKYAHEYLDENIIELLISNKIEIILDEDNFPVKLGKNKDMLFIEFKRIRKTMHELYGPEFCKSKNAKKKYQSNTLNLFLLDKNKCFI